MATTTVVRGIREINIAFAQAGKTVAESKQAVLKGHARPVARDAELLARGRINRIGPVWSQMRVGATPNLVYVAPQQRGTRIASRKRRNLARLLLTRAMQPALERNREQIARGLDEMLARMERQWGRR